MSISPLLSFTVPATAMPALEAASKTSGGDLAWLMPFLSQAIVDNATVPISAQSLQELMQDAGFTNPAAWADIVFAFTYANGNDMDLVAAVDSKLVHSIVAVFIANNSGETITISDDESHWYLSTGAGVFAPPQIAAGSAGVVLFNQKTPFVGIDAVIPLGLAGGVFFAGVADPFNGENGCAVDEDGSAEEFYYDSLQNAGGHATASMASYATAAIGSTSGAYLAMVVNVAAVP